MAMNAVSLGILALILSVAIIVADSVPENGADALAVSMPEEQQDELLADGQERTARSLGFGVGIVDVGISPIIGYPGYGYGGGYPYGYYGSRYPSYYGGGGYGRYGYGGYGRYGHGGYGHHGYGGRGYYRG